MKHILHGLSMLFGWFPMAVLPKRYTPPADPWKADREALASDWRAVGMDMRKLLPILLSLAFGVGCADLTPVVLPAPTPPPPPVVDPTPAPTPLPVPVPTPGPVSDAWAAAEALVARVQAGEPVTVAEVSERFGAPTPRHTRPDGLRVVTWRVPDATGANVLNVHAAVDADGRVVEVNPR